MDVLEGRPQEPFRATEIRPKCAFCHELTDEAACPRCGRPLCAQHAVAGERRCDSCEEELAALIARAERRAMRTFWIAGLIYIGLCGVGGISGAFTRIPEWAGAVLGMSPIGLAVAFFVLSVWLQRAAKRRRRRFLKERAPAPAPDRG